jgi:hypothetical protein
MRRSELERLIRAAARVSNDYEIIIVGSQSILGAIPNPPEVLTMSNEADMYPKSHPERANDIDFVLGEGSDFHRENGYYAQGVGPQTATLPEGWQERLVPVQNKNTDQRIGWCLEPHDLAASKLVAARTKDLPFVEAMLQYRYIDPMTLRDRVRLLPLEHDLKERIVRRIDGMLARAATRKPGSAPTKKPSIKRSPKRV